MDNFEENPYAYFHYLKLCKKTECLHVLSDVNNYHFLHSKEYYDNLSLNFYICELVYNAINLFPDISEYTIKCQNENSVSYLKFGVFNDIDSHGRNIMAKIISTDDEDIYLLDYDEIKKLYCNNRDVYTEETTINTIIVLLSISLSSKITTSYKINPGYLKNTLKFK